MSAATAVTRVDGMDDQARARARQIKARRERLGMRITDLAKEADVNRGQLGEYESTKHSPSEPWIRKVENTLDRLEHETGIADESSPARPLDPEGEFVEFTVEGNLGVKVVVKGPVKNMAELQAAAERLVAGMQRDRPGESTGQIEP